MYNQLRPRLIAIKSSFDSTTHDTPAQHSTQHLLSMPLHHPDSPLNGFPAFCPIPRSQCVRICTTSTAQHSTLTIGHSKFVPYTFFLSISITIPISYSLLYFLFLSQYLTLFSASPLCCYNIYLYRYNCHV